MNGPEHYREAERLLEAAIVRGLDNSPNYAADRPSLSDHLAPDCEGLGNLAAAQVHATLAHAAAVIDSTINGPHRLRNWRAWDEVLSS